jgi:purine-binding chemotaxis protein CheW
MTTDRTFRLDDRHIERVYARRAQQLSQRPAEVAAETVSALICAVGQERYGIELPALTEVIPYRHSTPVPAAPAALLGLINVRGDIKAVLDLRAVLELEHAGGETRYVVMLRQSKGTIGLGVERIEGVREIDPAKLLPAGSGTASLSGSRYVKAVTTDMVIMIDTNAVLSGLGLDRSTPT